MSGVEATLTKKMGPLPTWAWVLAGAGIGYLLLKRRSATATAAQVASGYLGTGGAGGPAVAPSGSSTVVTPPTIVNDGGGSGGGDSVWLLADGHLIQTTAAGLAATVSTLGHYLSGSGSQADPYVFHSTTYGGGGSGGGGGATDYRPVPGSGSGGGPGGSSGAVWELLDGQLVQTTASGLAATISTLGHYLSGSGTQSDPYVFHSHSAIGNVASSLSSGASGAPPMVGQVPAGSPDWVVPR